MMRDSHYPTITEWSEDNQKFVVTVPDLPGCFADGSTREEAARHTEAVIQDWIQTATQLGRPVPPPSAGLTV